MSFYNVCNKFNELWNSQYIEIYEGSYYNINGRLYHTNGGGTTDSDLRMELVQYIPVFKIGPKTKSFILPRSGQYKLRKTDIGLDTCVCFDAYNRDWYILHVNESVQTRVLRTKAIFGQYEASKMEIKESEIPGNEFVAQGFIDLMSGLVGRVTNINKSVGDVSKVCSMTNTILEHKDDVILLANTLDAASRAKQVVKDWFLRLKKWFDETMVTIKDGLMSWAGCLCMLVRSLIQHAKISLRKLYNFLKQLCSMTGTSDVVLNDIKLVVDDDLEKAKEVYDKFSGDSDKQVRIESEDDEYELQSGSTNNWTDEMGGNVLALCGAIVIPLLGVASAFGLIPMSKGLDKLGVFLDKFGSGRWTIDPFQKFFNVVHHWITGENYYIKYEVRSEFDQSVKECHLEIDGIQNLTNPPLVAQKKIANYLKDIERMYAIVCGEFPKDVHYLKTVYDNIVKRGAPWRCTFEGSKRMKPISIAISGQAGCGKTLTQDLLIEHVMKTIAKLSNKEGPVMDIIRKHSLASSELVMSCLGAKPEYDDGYQDPLFYVFNEYLTSKNLEVCEEWAQHFMKCMDDQPYMLNMAFGEKGNKYFHSPFIIATGNYSEHHINLKDPMAYHRRLHLDIRAAPAAKRGPNEAFDIMKHVKYRLTQKCLQVSMSNVAPSPVIRLLSKTADSDGIDFGGWFNFRTLLLIVVCMYLERIMTYKSSEYGISDLSKVGDISDFADSSLASFYLDLNKGAGGIVLPKFDYEDDEVNEIGCQEQELVKDMFNLFLTRVKLAKRSTLALKNSDEECDHPDYVVQGRRVRRQQRLDKLRMEALPIVVNYDRVNPVDYFGWREALFDNVYKVVNCESDAMPYDIVDLKGNAKRLRACFSDSLLRCTLHDDKALRIDENDNPWISYARMQFEMLALKRIYDDNGGIVRNLVAKGWRDFRTKCVRFVTLLDKILSSDVDECGVLVYLAFPKMSNLQRYSCKKSYERSHRLDKTYNTRTLDLKTGKPTAFTFSQIARYETRKERNIKRREEQMKKRNLKRQVENKKYLPSIVTVDKRDHDIATRMARDFKFQEDDWDNDNYDNGLEPDWVHDYKLQSGYSQIGHIIMDYIPDESEIPIASMKFRDYKAMPVIGFMFKMNKTNMPIHERIFCGYDHLKEYQQAFCRFVWKILCLQNDILKRKNISNMALMIQFDTAITCSDLMRCIVSFSSLFNTYASPQILEWNNVCEVLNGNSIGDNCEAQGVEFLVAYADFIDFEKVATENFINKCQGDFGKQLCDFFYNYGAYMLLSSLALVSVGLWAAQIYQYFTQTKEDRIIMEISEFQKLMEMAGMPVDIVPQGYHHNREKIIKNNVVNKLGKKLVVQGGGVSSGVFDVIQSNQYIMLSNMGNLLASTTFLCGRVAMMNKHVYETLDSFILVPYAGKTVSVTGYKMDKSDLRIVTELKGCDTILVVFPKVRMHANIVKHFVREDEMVLASYATTGLISCYSTDTVSKDACPIGSIRFCIRSTRPIIFPGHKDVELVRRILYHWPGAVASACGSIPILPVGGNLRIMGAHTAGSVSTQDGVSSIITYEMLSCLELDNYMNLPGASIADTISVENSDELLGSYELKVQGGWETPIHTNATDFTTFVPTPFQELEFEGGSRRIPAIMDNEAYQKGLLKESSMDSVINYDRRCPQWTMEYFDTILETYLGTDARVIKGCRTLTLDESLFGYKRLEKFDPKTSKGIRLRLLNLDKRKILAREEPDYSKYCEFHSKRDSLRVDHDIFQAQINYDKEKDECRDFERVINKKTRIFKITDFDDNVHIKRALGDLVERTKSLHWLGAQSCGIDPTSSGWRHLADKFDRLLVNFSDISGFESTLTDFILPFITRLCTTAYSDYREARYAVYAVMSCLYALRFNRGKGFCLGRGNTSGNWITTWLNTIVNMLYFSCVVIKGALENGIDPNVALRQLVIKLYSDDNLTHLPYAWYTPKFIESSFRELFGITVTGTDKGAVTDDGMGFISTADFLSRSFRKEKGQWCCPLSYDQLMTQLYFVRVPKRLRGNVEFVYHQLQLNLDNVMRELNEYPRDEALATVRRLRDFISAHSLPLTINFDFSDHAEIKLLRQ